MAIPTQTIKPTHVAVLRIGLHRMCYVNLRREGDYWVDGRGARYSAETGKLQGSDFAIIDLDTLIEKILKATKNT